MDNLKNLSIALIVAALVSAACWSVLPAKETIKTYGSVAGPDVPFQYFGVNGVRVWPGTQTTLTQASTTLCAIQSPNATSTLAEAGIRLDTGSTSALTIAIYKAASRYATTSTDSKFGTDYVVAASKTAFVHASTTPQAGAPEVFAPNQWLYIGQSGGITSGDTAGTGFVPAGRCIAEWYSYE